MFRSCANSSLMSDTSRTDEFREARGRSPLVERPGFDRVKAGHFRLLGHIPQYGFLEPTNVLRLRSLSKDDVPKRGVRVIESWLG